MDYLTLILLTLALGFGAQAYVNGKLKKYSKVSIGNGMTGAQAALRMLNYYGLGNVRVNMGGAGQDFFDPRTNSITLSPSSYNSTSVTATATACHEVGHACQFAFGYTPMKLRTAVVPVVNACSNAWFFILILGIFMNMIGLVWLAIILYAAVVLFSIVTLPVEFNASRRAIEYMGSINLSESDIDGSTSVLRACAFTYVAAALASLLQLVYLLIQADDR